VDPKNETSLRGQSEGRLQRRKGTGMKKGKRTTEKETENISTSAGWVGGGGGRNGSKEKKNKIIDY